MEQLDILVFGAHPDDAEIGMGGTIAKHTSIGYKVGICDLTQAEMSSNGTVELRQQEAAQASAVLGLSMRSCLRLPDRGLRLAKEHIDPIVAMIRTYRPRLVFAPYWEDRHPDHVMCSKLIEEAVFNAKLRKYMPELSAWQVEQTMFYYINDVHNVSLMINISEESELKEKALRAYSSQFNVAATSDGVATPLTNGYIERVQARDSLLAQSKGWQYAEGFTVKGPYPITTL
ncbi:bacillithiol biosynthesis deacetylase BshB1 [Paenibacillus camelliae]|uniref:bacillithiol biosynthesis deacetylase BshB1 n=1 Tax=Paenibacillus camelliae TaxID=512410 RepID=UPI00203B179F|nr:bacillithiol biosynthesis deacetylase BshB1 [Paenibacillus camelliae]MCM3633037.1 bacillithiol biosynthesis deacetylase BshB1 [Paenibacillus camelliae]